jgi:hypothetical protein
MDTEYYDTLSKLQDMGVDKDYFIGWAGGYLENPEREEQRVNEAYEAGYEDGKAHNTDQAGNFVN